MTFSHSIKKNVFHDTNENVLLGFAEVLLTN